MNENGFRQTPIDFLLNREKYRLSASERGLIFNDGISIAGDDRRDLMVRWVQEILNRDHYFFEDAGDLVLKVEEVPRGWGQLTPNYSYIVFDGWPPEAQARLALAAIKTLHPYAKDLRNKIDFVEERAKTKGEFDRKKAFAYFTRRIDRVFNEIVLPAYIAKSAQAQGEELPHFRLIEELRELSDNLSIAFEKVLVDKGISETEATTSMLLYFNEAVIPRVISSSFYATRNIHPETDKVLFHVEPPKDSPPIMSISLRTEEDKKNGFGIFIGTYILTGDIPLVLIAGHTPKYVTYNMDVMNYAAEQAISGFWEAYKFFPKIQAYHAREGRTKPGVEPKHPNEFTKYYVSKPMIDDDGKPYRGSMPALMATTTAFLREVADFYGERPAQVVHDIEHNGVGGNLPEVKRLWGLFKLKNPDLLPFDREGLQANLPFFVREGLSEVHDIDEKVGDIVKGLMRATERIMGDYLRKCNARVNGGRY